jgi:acetylornithine/N-succinyldiaminopimelate aminotransferase
MGVYMTGRLHELAQQYPIRQVRGQGLLQAFELERGDGASLVETCREGGLLINSPNPSTIRLMPPLIVTEAEIDEMIGLLSKAMDAIE